MNHNKLKSALEKFKDVTVKEQITGEYTPDEVNEIWAKLSTNQQQPGVSKQTNHTGTPPTDEELKLENKRLADELAELKKQGNTNAKPSVTTHAKTPGRNSTLKIPQFTGKRFTGSDFEAYQEVVRSLDQRTLYDWSEYKAVGIWNEFENPQTGEIEQGNLLKGIELVETSALKHTAMSPAHIEYWMTGQRGKKVMGGMNAQIYDKSNNRANSRFYLLRGVILETE